MERQVLRVRERDVRVIDQAAADKQEEPQHRQSACGDQDDLAEASIEISRTAFVDLIRCERSDVSI